MMTVYSKSGSASISLKMSAIARTLHVGRSTWGHSNPGCPAWWMFCRYLWVHRRIRLHFCLRVLCVSMVWLSVHRFPLRFNFGIFCQRHSAAPLNGGTPQAFCGFRFRITFQWGLGLSEWGVGYYEVLLDANDVPITRVLLLLVEWTYANGH